MQLPPPLEPWLVSSWRDHKEKPPTEEKEKSAMHWSNHPQPPLHIDSLGGFKDCGHQALASGDTELMDLGSSLGTGISFLKTENPCLRETVIGIQ